MQIETQLIEAVAEALAQGSRLSVSGLGSKREWLPAPLDAQLLSVSEHQGIVDYQPTELVVTVRCGTPLKDLNLELAQHDQCLASDPPMFFGGGSVGGAVASGLSGPARPWHGRLRDAVLGLRMINGLGEALSFGGQVMKNVAGYDVSRLLTGSAGALGVITEVSLRVAPLPECQRTLRFDVDAPEGLRLCRSWAGRYLPLSATCWHAGQLYVRLSGSESAVVAAQRILGGEPGGDKGGEMLWTAVRDHHNDFFRGIERVDEDAVLWRMVVPPATPIEADSVNHSLIEWGGGLRWMWARSDSAVEADIREAGGWAWARGGMYSLAPAEREVMGAIKDAFDPQGIFVSPLDLRHVD